MCGGYPEGAESELFRIEQESAQYDRIHRESLKDCKDMFAYAVEKNEELGAFFGGFKDYKPETAIIEIMQNETIYIKDFEQVIRLFLNKEELEGACLLQNLIDRCKEELIKECAKNNTESEIRWG